MLGRDVASIKESIQRHVRFSIGKAQLQATALDHYEALALSVRDHLLERWICTQQHYYKVGTKRVYYLSLEYLMGRTLRNAVINLGLKDQYEKALAELDLSFDELEDLEGDAALGNGGLGRLAACFLDSMATLGIPGYGYGIRYDYGIFRQVVDNGWQVEEPDDWLRLPYPWEIRRPEHFMKVQYGGRVETYAGPGGDPLHRWCDTNDVLAIAYDVPIPGYGNHTVNTMRLWRAQASEMFDLRDFNAGDYIGAVDHMVLSRTISRVLYPSDNIYQGQELRLKQQYFLVSASLQDAIRRHLVDHPNLDTLADSAVFQLNDTHPALAVAELHAAADRRARLPLGRGLEHHASLDGVHQPHAAARGAGDVVGGADGHAAAPPPADHQPHQPRVPGGAGPPLPRRRGADEAHLDLPRGAAQARADGQPGHHRRVLGQRRGRAAHQAAQVTRAVRLPPGLAGEVQQQDQRRDPAALAAVGQPTAGLADQQDHRPRVATNLAKLKELSAYSGDPAFQDAVASTKREAKVRLSNFLRWYHGQTLDPDAIFDVQVKRIHEYKRQLLNILHVIHLYRALERRPDYYKHPRTFLFGGKAAPSYTMAKLIVKLINDVSTTVNNHPEISRKLRVFFVPDYSVSKAELMIPAADVSEQISTAGFEASGTGNMKFMLNGALTVGTLDGANVEMAEEVGNDNIFIFGLMVEDVTKLHERGYRPRDWYESNPNIREVIDLLSMDYFNRSEPGIYRPIVDALLGSDHYLHLADFDAYRRTHLSVDQTYGDRRKWMKMAVENIARGGKFSSDRTILDYARDIWKVAPVTVPGPSNV
jgi:starch phosphorylase